MAIYSGFSHTKIVIFHSYVSLPEVYIYILVCMGQCQCPYMSDYEVEKKLNLCGLCLCTWVSPTAPRSMAKSWQIPIFENVD